MLGDVEYDNQLVHDLVKYVCTWDWKVSAAGIFNIDKTLISGVSYKFFKRSRLPIS